MKILSILTTGFLLVGASSTSNATDTNSQDTDSLTLVNVWRDATPSPLDGVTLSSGYNVRHVTGPDGRLRPGFSLMVSPQTSERYPAMKEGMRIMKISRVVDGATRTFDMMTNSRPWKEEYDEAVGPKIAGAKWTLHLADPDPDMEQKLEAAQRGADAQREASLDRMATMMANLIADQMLAASATAAPPAPPQTDSATMARLVAGQMIENPLQAASAPMPAAAPGHRLVTRIALGPGDDDDQVEIASTSILTPDATLTDAPLTSEQEAESQGPSSSYDPVTNTTTVSGSNFGSLLTTVMLLGGRAPGGSQTAPPMSVNYNPAPLPEGQRLTIASGNVTAKVLEEAVVDEQCVICLGEFAAGNTVHTVHGCDHVFHGDCLDAWSGPCPTCRHQPNSTEIGSEST